MDKSFLSDMKYSSFHIASREKNLIVISPSRNLVATREYSKSFLIGVQILLSAFVNSYEEFIWKLFLYLCL
ncbi:hypothetical protein D3Z36_12290 [Lachnospiraceae bacterium]|nr:hypothetical protein [Lachnospiraceae bacterium]